MGVRRFEYLESGVKDLANDPKFVDGTSKTAANLVASAARQLAPPGGPARGYKGRIRTTVEVDAKGRIFGRVHADDIAAHIVEWGSVNNPAYAPLRRAAEQLGLKLTADDKAQ